MAKLTFAEQIKHPNWQKKRLEVMESAGFECEHCGTDEVTLNVHHKRYVKGRMYWDYDRSELKCLCEDCHKQEHAERELLDRILYEASEQNGSVYMTAAAMLAGYFFGQLSIEDALCEEATAADGHTVHLGVLASIASGASWAQMAEAAKKLRGNSMTPTQEHVYRLWSGEA